MGHRSRNSSDRCCKPGSLQLAAALLALLGCVDPPGEGTFVLQFQRTATPGLDDFTLHVAKVQASYASPPAATGKTGLPDPANAPGESGVPRLEAQCTGLSETVDAVSQTQAITVDFHIDMAHPYRAGSFALPAGRVKEIRLVVTGGITNLDGETRPVFFEQHCSDVAAGALDSAGLIRIVPLDPEGFLVEEGKTTVATAGLNAQSDLLILRHKDQPPTVPGNKIGHSKLFMPPFFSARHSVLTPAQETVLVNDFFVGYTAGTSKEDIAAINAPLRAFVRLDIPDVPAQWVHVRSTTVTAEDVVRYYAGDTRVMFIEPVFRPGLHLAPNDPDYGSQFEKGIVHAEAAWEKTTGTHGVTVAVIDTGIDLSNPDLIDNIAINQAEVPPEVRKLIVKADGDDPATITFADLNAAVNDDPAICKKDNSPPYDLCDPLDLVNGRATLGYGWQDGIDGDGNDLIDDVVGWSFNDCGLNTNSTDILPGCGNNLPIDTHGHGTAVAGVLGAVGDNELALAGTAWRIGLTSYAVLDPFGGTGGTNVHQWAGIKYAAKTGHPIANLSSGATYYYGVSMPAECGGEAVIKSDATSLLVQQEKKIWASADISSMLLVTAVQNCPINYDDYRQPDQVFDMPSTMKLMGFDNILPVTSSDASNTIVEGRGGSLVDLVAPGEKLTVLRLRGALTDPASATANCSYMVEGKDSLDCSGASFAAPQVSAAAALLLTIDPTLRGQPVAIKQRLRSAANDLFDGAGGAGLLDLQKLVAP